MAGGQDATQKTKKKVTKTASMTRRKEDHSDWPEGERGITVTYGHELVSLASTVGELEGTLDLQAAFGFVFEWWITILEQYLPVWQQKEGQDRNQQE